MVLVAAVLGLWGGLGAVRGAAPATAQAALGWPQFRGGPAHAGSDLTGSRITPVNVSTLAKAWGPKPGGGVSSPAVVGGVVYSGSGDHDVHAFDASNGTELWSTSIGTTNPSSPAVTGGVVYIGSLDHRLYALDAADGRVLWTGQTGDEIDASPVVSGGVVYVSSHDGRLYAFDARGGLGCSGAPKLCQPMWTAATLGPITSTAAVVDGVVYVGSDRLYAFDGAGATGCTGTPRVCSPLWTGTTGSIDSSPAVAGGVVYVGSNDQKLYAFDAAATTGCAGSPKVCAPLWTGATGGAAFSSPAVAGGVVYVGSFDKRLYAFDAGGVTGCSGAPKSCVPLWTSEALSDLVISSPAAVGGLVFLGEGAGGRGVLAFDAAGTTGCSGTPKVCAPVWAGAMPAGVRSSPAVAGSMVYAGSDDGTITAVAVPEPLDLAGGRFNPVGPARILDTRNGTGGSSAPIGPGATRNVPLSGRGGVPATGVSAVVVNVTATQPSAASYLTIHPSGSGRPVASNLNFGPGQTVANLSVVPVGTSGSIDVFNAAGTTHLVVDIVGWLGIDGALGGSRYNATPPARIFDTRGGAGGGAAELGPGATAKVFVRGRGGLPVAGMTSVLLNVTATQPTVGGYLTVHPSGSGRPLASNLNFGPGQTVANLTVVPVGPDGSIDVFNASGATHVIVDAVGWFGADGAPAGARHNPTGPARIVDTRIGTGTAPLPVGAGATRVLRVTGRGGVPVGDVYGVVLNVTATQPSAGGYLTVYASMMPQPNTSNLNFAPGQTAANLVVVPLGPEGTINVFNATGTTHLVIDVVGWLAVGSS